MADMADMAEGETRHSLLHKFMLQMLQLDHKVAIPPQIMNKMLPGKIKDWNAGVTNHYLSYFGKN